MTLIDKKLLEKLYVKEGKSMQEIANALGCSVHKVQYWLAKHQLPRRSIGEAIYRWHNPKGDPFQYRPPRTRKEAMLFGMGIGLYWGEGTKADRYTVRLGNTDPALLNVFLEFIARFYNIKRKDCRFGLQIFSDMKDSEALDFWCKKLKIRKRQFQKIVCTPSGSLGTYRRKSQYGVLTIYYGNRKLRDLLIEQLRHNGYAPSFPSSQAAVAQW